MQRTIIVLVLVAGALGVLLFGVLHRKGSAEPEHVRQPSAAADDYAPIVREPAGPPVVITSAPAPTVRHPDDVCGQVVDAESGKAIASFKARLRLDYPGAPVTQPLPASELPFSSPIGEYCLPGVRPSSDGAYVIEARAEGYAPGFSAPFSVSPGESTTVPVIRLGHGGSLRGRVVDSAGRPVANARVTTRDNEWTDDAFIMEVGDEFPTIATIKGARTDAQGQFLIENLYPELYQITIDDWDFLDYTQHDLAIQSRRVNDIGEVRLLRGGKLEGTLFGPTGWPLGGASLELTSLGGEQPLSYRAKSGQDGTYHITKIRPGAYRLNASAMGDGSGKPFEDAKEHKSSGFEVTLADGEVLTGVRVTITP